MQNIFIGIAGHVVALDRHSGSEIWKTKLKGSSSAITNIVLEGDILIAYSGGHLFAVNAATGDILWENPLKGLGYSACIIAGSQQANTAQAASNAAQSAAIVGAVAATTAVASS